MQYNEDTIVCVSDDEWFPFQCFFNIVKLEDGPLDDLDVTARDSYFGLTKKVKLTGAHLIKPLKKQKIIHMCNNVARCLT